MALLVKTTADQFILGSSLSVSGRIFLCTPKDNKNSQIIAKKLPTTVNTLADYKAQGDRLKSSLMKSLYIVMPDQIFEHEKEVYILMPRMIRSVQDIIQEYKRQGKLIPIKLVKRILNDSIQGLKKVHSKKLFHGHIKPGNILQNDEEDWNLSDFGVFSCDPGEDYWSPEQVQNVSKVARLGASQVDQIVEAQRNDMYSLGITLLVLATLKKPSDYFCYRDNNQETIQQIKDKLGRSYGDIYCKIVDSMLQPTNKRKKVTELDDLIEQFLEIPDTDFDDSGLEPDTSIIMDEFKSRVIGKRENIQDFLKKYELNVQNSKILCSNFYQSLDDLQLSLSMQEKAALEKQLDPRDSGYFDLSQLIKQSLVGTLKMFDLKPQEAKSLKELLSEMNTFIQENDINLIDKFSALDKAGRRFLDVTEFNDALTDLGLGLQNDDLRLVRLRFDPEKKGVIYYDFFCDEMIGSKNGQELGLDGIIDQVYSQIREHFNTLDAFFKRYDISSRGHLKDTEFSTFMNEFNINPSNAVMRGLMEQLDPKGKKIILYDTFRNILQDRVDSELKRMLNSLCGFLKKENKYFIPVCKTQTKSNRIISPEKLFDAFRSVNSTIRRPELDFLINQLKADKQESIEYQDFSISLIKLSKQLGVQNSQHFGDSPKQEYYDDEEEEKPQSIDGCKNLLLAIMNALDAKRKGPASFFPKTMERQELRDKLREIQVDYREYDDEWDVLMSIILISKSQLNGTLLSQMLIEVARGQKQNKPVPKESSNGYQIQQATVQITQMIRKIMKQRGLDDYTFRDLDTMHEGSIKIKDFDKEVSKMGVDIDDPNYLKYVKFMQFQDNPQTLVLQNILRGFKEDDKAEQLLQDVMHFDDVFTKFDKNKNDRLEEQEFKKFITDVIPDVDERIMMVLFMKLDINCDKSVSVREFYTKKQEKQPKEQPKEQPNRKQQPNKTLAVRCAYEIFESMKREGFTRKAFDSRGRGICPIATFNDILKSDLGIDADNAKVLIQLCQSDDDPKVLSSEKIFQFFDDIEEAQNLLQEITQTVQSSENPEQFMKELFRDYDSSESGKLTQREFQQLIREIDSTARQKPIENLFYILDKNNDGSIQTQEFKNGVITKSLKQSQVKQTRQQPEKQPETKQSRFEKEQPRLEQSRFEQPRFEQCTDSQLLDFIIKSPYLPEALEKLDTNSTNQLKVEQVIQAIEDSHGPSGVQVQQIRSLAQDHRAIENTNVNYKLLIKGCRESTKQNKSKLDRVCEKLQQDLGFKNVDLMEMCAPYDRDDSNRVKTGVISSELDEKGIKISKDDLELLFSLVQPDERGFVNYQELNELIMKGPKSMKSSKIKDTRKIRKDDEESDEEEDKKKKKKKDEKKMKISRIDVDDAYDTFIDCCTQYMDKMNYTVNALFRRCDKNNNDQLSFAEFYKNLLKTIEMDISDEDLAEHVFKRLDTNKDEYLSCEEFEQAFDRPLKPDQINRDKQLIMSNKDPKVESNTMSVFKRITSGKEFNFAQFTKFIKSLESDINIIEIHQLFKYFDRQQKERVNYETFNSVMREGQSNVFKQVNSLQVADSSQIQKKTYFQTPIYEENMEQSERLQTETQSFDRTYYEDQLRQKAIQYRCELFDLLCSYDVTQLPDFALSSVQDLQKIFEFLNVKATQPTHISEIYYYYSSGEEQMRYLELCLRTGTSPGKLLAKALNFTIQKHSNYTVQVLWNIIGGQQPKWTINQFQMINNNLKLNFTNQEIEEAFQEWDRSNTKQIIFEQYSNILKQNLIKKPEKNQAPLIRKPPKEVLAEFMTELGAVVHSKGCFNLFEDCDPQQTNLITMNDFERVTRMIMSDLSTEHLVSLRQVLSKDGYINLSDLAKSLNKTQLDGDKFNLSQEKKQFGIQEQQKVRAGPLPTQQEFQQIMSSLNEFLRKKQRTYDDLGYYYFPQNSTIDRPQFIVRSVEMGINQKQAELLFEYLDVNASGTITVNEFRVVFPKSQLQRNVENVVVGKEIEDEIRELFEKIDVNKSSSIERPELKKALMSCGLNPTEQELETYFQNFDRNKNGSISIDEFSFIMKDLLKKEMITAEDLLEELRREFRAVCNPTTRTLSKQQVQQVFRNIGINVKEDELEVLFQEIDEDHNNCVDIDEFIYFIQKNQSGLSAKASAAVMNIKGARRVSLHDLRDIFIQMPQNFIISFLVTQNKRRLNLPSSSLKPKLDSSGFFYQDLNYIDASNLNIKQSVLDRSQKNTLCYEIKILEATGVPIPGEKDISRQSFIAREVGFVLWDRAKQIYNSNTAYIKAGWQPEYEDRWTFVPNENSIYVRWANYDDRIDSGTDLILEMISYYNRKGTLVQISCSYGFIPIQQLQPGKQWVELRGGAPSRDIVIQKEDIRTNRTGWRSVVKSLSSVIKSQVLIEVSKVTTPPQISQLACLPQKCLLNKWALPLWKGFREYFGFRTVENGELQLSLSAEPRLKSWLNLIDCPDTYRPFANLWTECIEPKCNNHQFQLNAAQAIGDYAYMMFVNSEFKFSNGDPTRRTYLDTVLAKKRTEIVNDTINEIKFVLDLPVQNRQRKPIIYSNSDPLNIQEGMDFDDEDELVNFDKFLQKKSKRSQFK